MADLHVVTDEETTRAELVAEAEELLGKMNRAKRQHPGLPVYRSAAFLLLAVIEQLEKP